MLFYEKKHKQNEIGTSSEIYIPNRDCSTGDWIDKLNAAAIDINNKSFKYFRFFYFPDGSMATFPAKKPKS